MSDILIVGGGIIGMLTARELSLAGMKVTIVEQGKVGQESSWAGGGIISPLYPWRYLAPVSELARWGQAYYPELIDNINAGSGLDAEIIQNGLLVFSDEHKAALSWANEWQSNLQLVDNNEIIGLEPELSAELAASQQGIWMPEIRQVRNPRLVKTLRKYLENQSVKFIENTTVTGFLEQNGRVAGVKSNSSEIFADKVMLAGGAWSANLLKNINISVDVEPVKGQMILFKTEPNTVKRIILSQDRYIIPRRDGRVLVGSTVEHTGFEKEITDSACEELKQEAYRIIPCLQQAAVEHHWAGLRPGSKNGIPYICPIPEHEGLFLNAGHFRNGVVLGAASARLAADLILERNPIIEPSYYSVDVS